MTMLCRIPGSLLPPPPMTSSVRSEDEIDLVIEAAGKNRVILGSVESFNPVPDRSWPPSTLVLSNVRGSPPIFRILTLVIAQNLKLLIFGGRVVTCFVTKMVQVSNKNFRRLVETELLSWKARDQFFAENQQLRISSDYFKNIGHVINTPFQVNCANLRFPWLISMRQNPAYICWSQKISKRNLQFVPIRMSRSRHGRHKISKFQCNRRF